MKRSQVNEFHVGTPEYVIAHAALQQKKGRNPSVIFRNETNPRKALAFAKWINTNSVMVAKVKEDQWSVFLNGTSSALIHLDYQKKINKILFLSEDVYFQRLVKELAFSYALQFVVPRQNFPEEFLKLVPTRGLVKHSSESLMDFKKIPEGVTAMDDKDLKDNLALFVRVVKGMFPDIASMLYHLLMDIHRKTGITITIKNGEWSYNDEIAITFEVESGQLFKIWKNAEGHDDSWRLHFTPSYHPVLNGKEHVGMINGCTDAYISGRDYIDSVYSPDELAKSMDNFLITGWANAKHPFYAEGKTLKVRFSSILCMTKEGYDKLSELLIASLNQENKYISVSGGFNPPYDHPQNVLNKKGLSSPVIKQFGSSEIRGSEHYCVWEHQTLKEEGVLNGSIAPDWFYKEGWLNIYADQIKSSR